MSTYPDHPDEAKEGREKQGDTPRGEVDAFAGPLMNNLQQVSPNPPL